MKTVYVIGGPPVLIKRYAVSGFSFVLEKVHQENIIALSETTTHAARRSSNFIFRLLTGVTVYPFIYRFFRIVRSYDLLVQHQYYKVFERD